MNVFRKNSYLLLVLSAALRVTVTGSVVMPWYCNLTATIWLLSVVMYCGSVNETVLEGKVGECV